MKKIRSSPLSSLFPWLSPLIIKFAWVNGGIEVQLYKHNRLRKNWHPSQLHHVLPLPLARWIEDYQIHVGPQPYPLIKQLWQYLTPLASKKLIIDSSILAELEEVSQPQDFVLIWRINHSSVCIEGRYEGADRYLGMGWFQKGTKIWSLKGNPSNAIDAQLRNVVVPVQQADFLLKSIMPGLQQYLPVRADFQLISNFVVRVLVPDVRSSRLTLLLQCNYPQFLPIMQVPQQKVDVLLANQAIIRFPHQALTPVLIQLLQSGSSITIQGAGVPLFIGEQLPVMRHFYQISDDMAAEITQSNPIVPIATLRPTFTLVHRYERGIGKYTITATYQYQHHTLDMDALLAARQQNQRFVQQHGIWFEWPYNSRDLVNTILQQRMPQALRSEEVMGFDTRRIPLLYKQPITHTIQPGGTTPVERSESVFKQLRYHGIPGGIVGEPKELVTMFVNACGYVLRDNRQACILWLAPSNKKGSVTRAVHGSTISSYVTVASLVTLRDEPALFSRSWTLVLFQGLDILLDGSFQSRMLPQLKWQWALTSVTSMRALGPFIMQILHLPEQYYAQFCDRYLFDPLQNYNSAVTGQHTSGPNTAQSVSPATPKKGEVPHSVILSPPAHSIQTPRIAVQLNLETRRRPGQPLVQPDTHTPAKPVPDSARPKSAPLPIRHSIELNQKIIVQLHQESEQLQERLTVEDEEEQEQLHIPPMLNLASATPVVSEFVGPAPEVDEDWQIILQQWRPEHWEIIRLLYQLTFRLTEPSRTLLGTPARFEMDEQCYLF